MGQAKNEKLKKERGVSFEEMRKMRKYKLDKEEQEILDSIEGGKRKTVKNMKAEINKFAGYAKKTLKKGISYRKRIDKEGINE